MSQCEASQVTGQAPPEVVEIDEPSPLDQLLHEGARQMLMTAVEAEIAAYIEAQQHEVDERGRLAGRAQRPGPRTHSRQRRRPAPDPGAARRRPSRR